MSVSNEAFFLLLVYFLWKQEHRDIIMWWVHFLSILSDCIRSLFFEFYIINNIASFRALLACLTYLWNVKKFDRVSSYVFDELCMFCRQLCHDSQLLYSLCFTWWEKVMKSCCVRDSLWSSFFECTVHVLFSDSLLWDSYKVNSYQVSLNWNDNLSCNLWRDVCSQISDSYSHTQILPRCLSDDLYFAVSDLSAC